MRKEHYLRSVGLPSSAFDEEGCLDTNTLEGQGLSRLIEARANAQRRRRARRRMVLAVGAAAAIGAGGVALIAMPEPARRPAQLASAPPPALPSVTPVPARPPIQEPGMTVTPPPAPSPAVAPPQPPEKPSVARARTAAPAPSRVGGARPDVRRDPTKPAGSLASRATARLNRATRLGDARHDRVAAAPRALTGPGLLEERTLPSKRETVGSRPPATQIEVPAPRVAATRSPAASTPPPSLVTSRPAVVPEDRAVATSSSTAQSSSPPASVPSAVPRVATPPPVSEARAEPARPAAPTPRADERAAIAVPRHVWSTPGGPQDAVASAPTPPAPTPAPPTIEKRGFRVGTISIYMPEVMLYRTLAPKVRALLSKPLAEEVAAQP